MASQRGLRLELEGVLLAAARSLCAVAVASLCARGRRGAATLARLLNSDVKRREAFRPFAPAVLAERASEWLDGLTVDGSP